MPEGFRLLKWWLWDTVVCAHDNGTWAGPLGSTKVSRHCTKCGKCLETREVTPVSKPEDTSRPES